MKANRQKKSAIFWTAFFFNRSLKLVHLPLFWLRLQYTYEARFTMSAYLCIHCSQSFTFEHYFIGSLSERYINRKVTNEFLRRVTCRINYIWTFLWRTSNSILRPIKISSLKLKKSKWYSCRSFEVKEWWGTHSDVAVVKFKSNESESAKKNCRFLDYIFFYRSLKLVHLQFQLLG